MSEQTNGPGGPLGQLGRYLLHEKLGQGSFGVVYRAYDPVLERSVALKVPKLGAGHADQAARFLREAKSAARLRHPNVVTVYDCDMAGDQPFIALEFVKGQTLAERLRSGRPSPRQSAQWIRDLALALHYAHQESVVHRDVKPANIMIDQHGVARLMDFGLAKETIAVAVPLGEADIRSSDPMLTRHGMIVGTPAYMSPEQARGELNNVGPASDQFSLGIVLYELLTGRLPFSGTTDEVLDQIANPACEAKPPRVWKLDVSLGLEAIASKALRKNPRERYPDAAALAVDLARWLKGEPTEAVVRIIGKLVRLCPGCDRIHDIHKPLCLFCGEDLSGIEPTDSADYFAVRPDAIANPDAKPPTYDLSWLLDQLRVLPLWVYLLPIALICIPALIVNYLLSGERAETWPLVILSLWKSIPMIGQTGEGGLFVAFLIAALLFAISWRRANF